jgi:hypothetical protein
LRVFYTPKTLHKSQFAISVSVRDNPAANLTLNFTGEGFSEDVIFEGISDDGDLIFKDNAVG